MPLESTHFFIHPSGGMAPRSAVITALLPGPGQARTRIFPRGACPDHHSWKWSCPCLWTHVGYVAHSTQMAFYIYCLAYLVIFSHVYVCFQQADDRTFWEQEDHHPQFFPWARAFMGWWEGGKEPSRSSPPALVSLRPRAPEGRAADFTFLRSELTFLVTLW